MSGSVSVTRSSRLPRTSVSVSVSKAGTTTAGQNTPAKSQLKGWEQRHADSIKAHVARIGAQGKQHPKIDQKKKSYVAKAQKGNDRAVKVQKIEAVKEKQGTAVYTKSKDDSTRTVKRARQPKSTMNEVHKVEVSKQALDTVQKHRRTNGLKPSLKTQAKMLSEAENKKPRVPNAVLRRDEKPDCSKVEQQESAKADAGLEAADNLIHSKAHMFWLQVQHEILSAFEKNGPQTEAESKGVDSDATEMVDTDLATKLDTMTTERDTLQKEVDQLHETITKLKKEKKSILKKGGDQRRALTSQNADLEKEVNRLTDTFNDLLDTHHSLEFENESLRAYIDDDYRIQTEQQRRIQELENTVQNNLQRAHNQLWMTKDLYEGKIKDLKREVGFLYRCARFGGVGQFGLFYLGRSIVFGKRIEELEERLRG